MNINCSSIAKFQAPKNKSQTNSNDPNSKFETDAGFASQPAAWYSFMLKVIITASQWFAGLFDATTVGVLVVECCDLRFICNLVLEIWNFMAFSKLLMQTA
jgi:hypothetical protein